MVKWGRIAVAVVTTFICGKFISDNMSITTGTIEGTSVDNGSYYDYEFEVYQDNSSFEFEWGNSKTDVTDEVDTLTSVETTKSVEDVEYYIQGSNEYIKCNNGFTVLGVEEIGNKYYTYLTPRLKDRSNSDDIIICHEVDEETYKELKIGEILYNIKIEF